MNRALRLLCAIAALMLMFAACNSNELVDTTSFIANSIRKQKELTSTLIEVEGNAQSLQRDTVPIETQDTGEERAHQNHFIHNHGRSFDDMLEDGLDKYWARDYSGAIKAYEELLSIYPHSFDAWYNLGVVWQHCGNAPLAIECYEKAIHYNPDDNRSRLNLASMYHLRGDISMAVAHYRSILEVLQKKQVDISFVSKVKSNLGAAYLQLGIITQMYQAFAELRSLRDILARTISSYCLDGSTKENLTNGVLITEVGPECEDMQSNYDSTVNMILNTERSVSFLGNREYIVQYLLCRTLTGTDGYSSSCVKYSHSDELLNTRVFPGSGPLLPFDTLVSSVSLNDRLLIANARSNLIINSLPIHDSPTVSEKRIQHIGKDKPLRIGFISCDFNDHPTAHLVEGIFSTVRRLRQAALHSHDPKVELVVFSYGKDDNSHYRRNLEKLSDKFVDLVLLSNQESITAIKKEAIDIMLDMQLHTLGHRLEITAAQPSSIQMNYLVYPGTSGASFLQYIVADSGVIPPEHANFYSESLLYLPTTYQVSFYDRYFNQREVRSRISPPLSTARRRFNAAWKPLVLCNFNKVDKLDIDSFAVWSQVMHRIGKSEFWFLDPAKKDSKSDSDQSDHTVRNMKREMMLRGITADRIKFVERLDKEEHIERHKGADLFLDSLVYGAHSTATDALVGGLPVLTVDGDSFPNRVAATLLKSFSRNPSTDTSEVRSVLESLLVMNSKKAFEDMAVHLLKSEGTLKSLRYELQRAVNSAHVTNAGVHSRATHIGEPTLIPSATYNCGMYQCSGDSPPGFFDSTKLVREFLYGMQASFEVEHMRTPQVGVKGKSAQKLPHVIVSSLPKD